MDTKEYIASGILEQYALGLTSEQETVEVESYVRQYPEITAELYAIQDALLQYSATYSRKPAHDLEQRILDKIETLEKPAGQQQQLPSPVSGIGYRYRRAVVMAGISLLFAMAALLYLFQQYQKNKANLNFALAQMEQLRTECENMRNNNTKMAQYIAAVGDAGNKPIAMLGLDIAPDAVAIVHWNQNKKEAFIEIKNLPSAPVGKQYQLWAIVEGKPTDMGVFTLEPGENNLKTVPFIANPQAFAVTLENEGGSTEPTLDQMYLLGNV